MNEGVPQPANTNEAPKSKAELIQEAVELIDQLEFASREDATKEERAERPELNAKIAKIMLRPDLGPEDYRHLKIWDPRFEIYKQQKLNKDATKENVVSEEQRSSIPPDPESEEGQTILNAMGYTYQPSADGVSQTAA
jgi:hypothetical protein